MQLKNLLFALLFIPLGSYGQSDTHSFELRKAQITSAYFQDRDSTDNYFTIRDTKRGETISIYMDGKSYKLKLKGHVVSQESDGQTRFIHKELAKWRKKCKKFDKRY